MKRLPCAPPCIPLSAPAPASPSVIAAARVHAPAMLVADGDVLPAVATNATEVVTVIMVVVAMLALLMVLPCVMVAMMMRVAVVVVVVVV